MTNDQGMPMIKIVAPAGGCLAWELSLWEFLGH